jgi:hypothetical protein
MLDRWNAHDIEGHLSAMGFFQPTRIQVKLLKPDLAIALTWWSASFPTSKVKVVGNTYHGPSATREEHITPRQVEVLLAFRKGTAMNEGREEAAERLHRILPSQDSYRPCVQSVRWKSPTGATR